MEATTNTASKSKNFQNKYVENHIAKLPGCYYIPNYIKAEDGKQIFTKSWGKGRTFRTITGGTGPKVAPYVKEDFPEHLKVVVDQLLKDEILSAPPFQISVNVYDQSPYWMIPHKDGRGTEAVLLSFGASVVLDFYHRPRPQNYKIYYTEVYNPEVEDESTTSKTPCTSLLLEPNSVLVMSGECFTEYAHGIQKRTEDKVTEDIGNLHLLTTVKKDDVVVRQPRVSVVMWPG